MTTARAEGRYVRHEVISAVTAVRLLVDGWRDGLVDARPGTADGERLHGHVRALTDLVEGLTPVVARVPAPARRASR